MIHDHSKFLIEIVSLDNDHNMYSLQKSLLAFNLTVFKMLFDKISCNIRNVVINYYFHFTQYKIFFSFYLKFFFCINLLYILLIFIFEYSMLSCT